MVYDEIFMEGYYDALAEAEDDLDIYDDYDNEIDFDNEYEDAYMEGYYTALDEIISNPLPIIGGGDIKGDILAHFGLGNGPERAAAIKNYYDTGNTITGGLLGGTYGTQGGMAYRKNKYLPGEAGSQIDGPMIYQSMFMRLKPADRKKIMDIYKKTKR